MKIAVIGGGPAGLVAARTAAENGLEVTLFERYKIGEHINCGEGFFDLLKLWGKPKAGVLFQVKEILLKINNLYRIDSSRLNIWMIDRFAWQQYLAETARLAGVTILEETPVHLEDIKFLKKDFNWIIDASGVHALTLKAEGNKGEYKKRRVFTLQYKLEGDFSFLKDSLKAVIEPYYIGYYWVFPKIPAVKGTANVGLGVIVSGPRTINLHREMSRILQQENLEKYRVMDCKAGKIPLTPITPLLREKILLVGDAAGIASTLHGGGLDVSLLSGKLAALSLAEGKPQRYEELLRKKIGLKLAYESKMYELWERQGSSFIEKSIKMALIFGQNNFRRGLFKVFRSAIKSS